MMLREMIRNKLFVRDQMVTLKISISMIKIKIYLLN